jgi:hypothetical protein
MRITNWEKFNESVSEEFTEEMAQEIIYSFSEGTDLSGELNRLVVSFVETVNKENIDSESHFGMYETSYGEMKVMVRKLYGFAQTESLTFREEMIQLYHEIRKVKEKFPEVYEIEDLFLTFLESNNFEFYLDYMKPYGTSTMIYQIRLRSKYDANYSMQDFHKFCDTVGSLVERFSHPSSRMLIKQCKYYNFDEQNKASVDFDIIIK